MEMLKFSFIFVVWNGGIIDYLLRKVEGYKCVFKEFELFYYIMKGRGDILWWWLYMKIVVRIDLVKNK